ncbi:MAG: triose-phosphate isomerase [Megasphaera sp.]|jgi:triosephosphate isomerase|uniref:triose-phosphate isomerase n=1 Tax=Megasphaera sueciensis TaxID=349094 RepID=UPI003D041C27|nr:triose-phosphate isomerase [Megasphaera sp.]MCI1823254.1 triose-phosphate isomerase [Megasphaera sp.]
MRKTIIAGNWKMNHTGEEGAAVLKSLVERVTAKDGMEVVVAPVFPYLASAVQITAGSSVTISAQNMHWKDTGAYTGEVSPAMLIDIGVTHVIIGHSERREYFNETDETVNLKVKAALSHKLTPIVCCGESLEQRERGEMKAWIEGQIRHAFADIAAEDMTKVVIAYEPIWAIGTGRTATHEQAQEVCAIIRRMVGTLYNSALADRISILYGGSVKGGNIAVLTQCADIDGALVGGASLQADDFMDIIDHAVVK